MSYIKEVIGNKTFNETKQLLRDLNLEIKENDKTYMVLFTEKSDLSLPLVRDCTGIVFEKETNKLLHFSFQKCYEGLNFGHDNFNEEKLEDMSIVNLYFTGSLIKIFYYDNNWHIASSKNINASNTYWGSKRSFKELFIDCIEISYDLRYDEFLEKLDKSYCYTYIIQHPEINNMLKIKTPLAFILNKVNTETLEEVIPDLQNLLVNKTVKEIKNTKNLCENYIIYNIDPITKNVKNRIKVLSEDYYRLQEIYGNYPDIGLRYLEGDFNIRQQLRREFPYEAKFIKIDILYNKSINYILMSYENVFIKKTKKITDVPKNHVNTIKILNKMNKKIEKNDIYYHLKNNKNIKEVAYIINYIY